MGIWTFNLSLLSFLGLYCGIDAAISAWTTPSITGADGTGTLTVAENQALATTIETYAATSDGTLGDFSLTTTGTPFSLTTGGILTITSALDFETRASYTLVIKVVDNAPATGTATITVTVTDVNEAPTFAASIYGSLISDGSTAGVTLTTVSATDQDSGDTITYSINSGSTNTDFTIGASTGVITNANTMDKATTVAYKLEVFAVDNDGSPLTGTTSVIIVVGSCSGVAALYAGLSMTVLAGLLAALQ